MAERILKPAQLAWCRERLAGFAEIEAVMARVRQESDEASRRIARGRARYALRRLDRIAKRSAA